MVTGNAMVSVYWADRGSDPVNSIGQPILYGDAAANHIVVDGQDFDDTITDTYPVAYGYGADDKFVVEGEVVTMDQFEEILLQKDPKTKLVTSLGDLSWVGYDFNRPRDGATWSITGLSCIKPPEGD